MEIWKDIEGCEGKYQIGTGGRIRSFVYSSAGTLLIGGVRPNGYAHNSLCHPVKGVITVSPHRLVAEYFIPNPDNKSTVNHIDGNKLNNNVENLEWATVGENVRHYWDTAKPKKSNWRPKLSSECAEEIKKLLSAGSSIRDLAKKYSRSESSIRAIMHGNAFKLKTA